MVEAFRINYYGDEMGVMAMEPPSKVGCSIHLTQELAVEHFLLTNPGGWDAKPDMTRAGHALIAIPVRVPEGSPLAQRLVEQQSLPIYGKENRDLRAAAERLPAAGAEVQIPLPIDREAARARILAARAGRPAAATS